jgi:hypothetical protein
VCVQGNGGAEGVQGKYEGEGGGRGAPGKLRGGSDKRGIRECEFGVGAGVAGNWGGGGTRKVQGFAVNKKPPGH